VRVLAVNCGSSSLKLRLCDAGDHEIRSLATGVVAGIGADAQVSFHPANGVSSRETASIPGYRTALRALLDLLGEERRTIEAVGHRVVRGGEFVHPAVIDDAVMAAIEAERKVAPLHTGPSLEGIAAAREYLPGVPMVAVFDTAFHSTLPAVAAGYALPHELVRKHRLRRSGYHGIAHRSMAERYAELAGRAPDDVTLITLQLGSGCSAAAVSGGKSVDTSMGFTPLEGLMMATRPGDLDPGAVSYLLREAGTSIEDVDSMLSQKSGLLGVSGVSEDIAVVLDEESRGNARAHHAIEMFCYRVRKYIGAYFAVLGKVEAVVFGGGIGEQPEVRRRICEPLECLGIRVDRGRNVSLDGQEGRLSADGSTVDAWVIPSDEERIIVRDAYLVLRGRQGP